MKAAEYVNVPLPVHVERVAHEVIGAAIEVHRVLGPGLLESIYEQALLHELTFRGLTVERQRPVPVCYKGVIIQGQRVDLLVEECVIVELKAISGLLDIHAAQLLTYLRISELPIGLLFNFNVVAMRQGIRRLVNERVLTAPKSAAVPSPL